MCSEEEREQEPKVSIDWSRVFLSREEFSKLVGVVCAGFIGLFLAIPGLGFAFGYFLVPQRRQWINLGEVDKYKVGETVPVVFVDTTGTPWDGICAKRAAWLRRV